VFVDPESKQITRIIDWQSASVMPLFYQCGIAQMFQCPWPVADNDEVPELPDNYDTLGVDEQNKYKKNLNIEIALKYYRSLTYRDNSRHGLLSCYKTKISMSEQSRHA
jgi:hypothetical protein